MAGWRGTLLPGSPLDIGDQGRESPIARMLEFLEDEAGLPATIVFSTAMGWPTVDRVRLHSVSAMAMKYDNEVWLTLVTRDRTRAGAWSRNKGGLDRPIPTPIAVIRGEAPGLRLPPSLGDRTMLDDPVAYREMWEEVARLVRDAAAGPGLLLDTIDQAVVANDARHAGKEPA